MKRLIIITPHPDDETLGAGGTILKHKDLGNSVYWLNISKTKEEYGYDKASVEKRTSEVKKVIEEYRFDGFFDLGLKPAALEQYPIGSLVKDINVIMDKVRPSAVILPYRSDVHSDHRVVFDAGYACTKVFRNLYIRKVLMMEIASETDMAPSQEHFSPNYFVDISDYLERKINIMKVYEGEYGRHPFPRSEENIRAIATTRGATAGCRYAEAFMTVKEIE